MANEKQFRPRTKLIAARGVKEYRETIAAWVNEDDVVLAGGWIDRVVRPSTGYAAPRSLRYLH